MKKLICLLTSILAFPAISLYAAQASVPARAQIHLILDSASMKNFEEVYASTCKTDSESELQLACELAFSLHSGNAEFFLRGIGKSTIPSLARLDKIYHVEKDLPMVSAIRKAGGIDLFYLSHLYALARKNTKTAVSKFFELKSKPDGYLAEYFDELALDFFINHLDLVVEHWSQIKNNISSSTFLTTNFNLTDKNKIAKRAAILCRKNPSSHCTDVIRFIGELELE